jgi:CRP-like cAMP-binding protein
MADFFARMKNFERYFIDEGSKVTYKKGQIFVRPEDENSWVYFLDTGLVEISYGFSDGSNRLLGYFFPGVAFAQNGSFFQNNGSGLEYAAVQETHVLRLPQKRFFEIMANDQLCSQEYVGVLLRNQFLLIERVAYMGEKTIERMVVRLISGLGKYYGHMDGQNYIVDIPITQEVIARFTHATRESVSKTMRSLTRSRIISLQKRQLTIHDMAALEKQLES